MHFSIRRLALLSALLALCLAAHAQSVEIYGRILENAPGRSSLPFVKVELMDADTTYAYSRMETGNDGRFVLRTWGDGKRLIRATLTGYDTLYHALEIDPGDTRLKLGDLPLTPKSYLLGDAVVTAQQQMLTIKADTFVFHTAAFQLPPGATLGALVQQIPGLEMDESGNLLFHGKTVSGILVDGHNFFTDNATALQNVTADAVQDVKVYERTDLQADFRREEQLDRGTVLDLTIKESYRRSWNVNLDAAAGTHRRYTGKGFASNFGENSRIALYGQTNNISQGQITDGNGNWYNLSNANGHYTYRTVGTGWSFDNGLGNRDAGYMEGSVSFTLDHNDGGSAKLTHAEQFVRDALTHYDYSRNSFSTHARDFRFNAELTLNFDSLNRINANAYGGFEGSRRRTYNTSSRFTAPRPGDDPSRLLFATETDPDGVNAVYVQSRNASHDSEMNFDVTYTHRFRANKKRNLEFYGGTQWTANDTRLHNAYRQRYFGLPADDANAALYQYTHTPSHRFRGDFYANWTDAIGSVFSYKLNYQFTAARKRADYRLETLDALTLPGADAHAPLDAITEARLFYNSHAELFNADPANTYDYSARYASHSFYFTLKADWDKFHFEATGRPTWEREHLDYRRDGQTWQPKRSGWTYWFNAGFRYNPVPTTRYALYYSGSSRQPDLLELRPFTDTSDPLSDRLPATGLKNSTYHTTRFVFEHTNPTSGASYNFMGFATTTHNAITTTQQADALTGHTFTSQTNVDGNYNYNLNATTSQPLDSARRFKLNLSTSFSQRRTRGFVGAAGDALGLTGVLGRQVSAGATLAYNAKVFQCSLSANYTYDNTHAGRATGLNEHGHTIDTKLSPQITLPSGLRISTSLAYWARTGYSDDLLNHGQWLWNATISQSFLKNKALSVELQAVDLLHQRTAESWNVTTFERTYTRTTNAYLHYVLLHISYKFSIN
ncbi:MAG: outer membrane beta-barrel protein [Bacteroidaceae bacterium]|nr:outer membrane beta-barrel protein [Bacteroidaceae bacterium]